jgi:hypothetical protein
MILPAGTVKATFPFKNELYYTTDANARANSSQNVSGTKL